jgi:hypothetical protein
MIVDRMEMAKKFYTQAQKMTVGMAASVVAYGAIGFYLIQTGKIGPAILNAQIYPLLKYGSLVVSVLGIFAMGQLSSRMFSSFSVQTPSAERPPQKLFVRTVLMSAGAELPLLLGMVLVFLGHQPYDFIPFAVISLTGFAFAFPKRQEWMSWLGADF